MSNHLLVGKLLNHNSCQPASSICLHKQTLAVQWHLNLLSVWTTASGCHCGSGCIAAVP
jgi:hypothetical protein